EVHTATFIKIILKNNTHFPIYQHINQQLKQNILNPHLPPPHHFPSITQLPKHLQLTFITTKPPYQHLHKHRFLTTITPKATFVNHQDTSILKHK
ncbi:GntR family transcriptional regulator, partial [Staphylococcus aureus]|uniref:GntR family transcriptional regulator n=1 Tax=Staphylococcus aureus TaxID=1280 RepID=UPI001C92BB48